MSDKRERNAIGEKYLAMSLAQNHTFQRMVEETREELVKSWKAATTTADREQCWYMLAGLNKLMTHLRVKVERGTKKEIDQKREAERGPATREKQSPALDKSKE